MKTTFLFPVFLSLFVSYYFYKNNTSESTITYFLNLAFMKAPICIAFYSRESSTDSSNDLLLFYKNEKALKSPEYANISLLSNSDCLEVILVNSKGSSAFYSLSEPQIIDAHINGDIELLFSKDKELFEKQILILNQMVFDGLFSFGWVVQKAVHLYNHWIAQYINSYGISYDWIDLHYTQSDHIISAFVDDEYILYSHGIGYGPNLPANEDNTNINSSRLALDITLEESAANKMQFIVDECKLGPGSKVLDVGGGWGSFPAFAVPLGIHVHTLTISIASYDHLELLSKKLSNECECEVGTNDTPAENRCICGSLTVSMKNFWELRDTKLGRSMAGSLDAIVCLGTIEHLPYYERLMEIAEYYLKPGGYLHVDGFGTKLGFTTNYFIQRYIYPGDSSPFHASSYFKAWEKSDLLMVSAHFDRENYANTMYQWAQKFEDMLRNESHPLNSVISERSVRIFRLYLWGMVMSFQHPSTPVHGWRVVLQKSLF